MVALIFTEFEGILRNFQNELSLGEFAGFAKQLENAGYVIRIERELNGKVGVKLEKPTLRALWKRLVATLTMRRLSLTPWQLYVYKQKTHYNYKRNVAEGQKMPGWVERALGFDVEKARWYY